MDGQTPTVSTKIADVWMAGDRVIHIRFRAEDHHNIHDAREVVEAHNALAGDVPCPVLADIRDVRQGADREARQHYVSYEGSRLKTGMAMLVASPMQRMLGNIFFSINRPAYPTRLFTDESEALSWLHSLGGRAP